MLTTLTCCRNVLAYNARVWSRRGLQAMRESNVVEYSRAELDAFLRKPVRKPKPRPKKPEGYATPTHKNNNKNTNNNTNTNNKNTSKGQSRTGRRVTQSDTYCI